MKLRAEVPDSREITQYVKWKQFIFLGQRVIETSDVIMPVEVIDATEVFRIS